MLLACLSTLVVHLLSLTRRLHPDEGGFAMVARYAREPGGYLYGPQWVDRPPGLVAVFGIANRLGPYGVRLVATLLAVLLVAALASAAGGLGGRTAARWAAWTGFAFASSLLIEAQRLNGELVAATFVAGSVALLVRAVGGSSRRSGTLLPGVLAGASASSALLVKQSFVDAFVFAGVLLLLAGLTRANRLRYPPRRVWTTGGAFLAGAVVPAAATVVWARSRGGLGALGYAMFGFRGDAAGVMAGWSLSAPLHRLGGMLVLGLLSGLLVLLLQLAVSNWRLLRQVEPVPWAIAATVAVELLGIAAGENYWAHYLVALVPMVCVAAGLSVARRLPGWRVTTLLVVVSVLATAVWSPLSAVRATRAPSEAYTTGRWVSASAAPHDTIVVPFTRANVINASGLRPTYPYSWSLPVRTLDPHLTLLVTTLDGPTAPTWLVRWDKPHPWGLDPQDRVDAALHAHYRDVATVCGHGIWLHDGLNRNLARSPTPARCGTAGS